MSQIELHELKMNSVSGNGAENEVYRSNTPCNELEIINAIRENRFNVDLLNQTDVDNYLDKENEFTALHFAAHFNRHAVVKMLLEELKADMKKRDKAGNTAINIAARLGYDEVVSTMIDHDPEYTMLRGQFESIPLHNASLHGHCNVVKVLLNEHTSTSHSNQLKAMTGKSKQTPLHLAALYGHVKVVEFLLGVCSRLKIELNTLRNKFNGTPVHVAAYKGRTQIIKVMVKKYPDCLQYRDGQNGTIFLTACGYGHVQLAEQLITEHNVNIQGDLAPSKDEPDASMTTSNYQPSLNIPLVRACKYGRTEIVRLLFDKGVIVHPEAMVEAIKGGFSETAKELLSRGAWWRVLQYTYINEDGEETTPFRELVQHMPDVAEIVLNKCMEVTYKQSVHGYAVIFNYDYVDDFAEPERRSLNPSSINEMGVSNPNVPNDTTWERPKGFIKELHPLSLIVKYKRQKLLTHPVITSLIHYKWKSFGWISFLHWFLYLIHLCIITALALSLTHSRDSRCFNGNLTVVTINETNTTSTCKQRAKSATVLIKALATETVVCSLFGLVARMTLVLLALKRVISARDVKETNPLYQLQDFIECVVNRSTVSEFPLFILSLVYVVPVYFLDDCLCPFNWQSAIGTVVILLTWLKFIVLSTQFQFVGVYALMLSRVLVTFLKTAVLMCLLIAGFSLVFYLSVNDYNNIIASSAYFLAPGIALLKVIEGTVGEDFNSFVPTTEDDQLSAVYPYSALTIIIWIIFIIVMPVLFANLLIGLAVGDIKEIYDMANFEKQALQVEYILNIEDKLRHVGFRAKKTISKAYHEYSLREIVYNRLIVLLWGGESFDSRQSNQILLKHRQSFQNCHRFTPESKSKLATDDDVNQLRYSLEQLIKEKM